MKIQKQKGFTTLEMLLVLVILAIVGFTAYHVYNSRQQTDKLLNSAQNETSAVKITKKTSSAVAQQSVTIKEWGITLSFANAEKVTYQDLSCGSPNCSTDLVFNDSITSDPACKLVLEVVQENDGSTNPMPNIKIGSSSYGLIKNFNGDVEANFSKCNASVNNLRDSIRQAVSIDSISAS